MQDWIGYRGPATPTLLELLWDEDPDVRVLAAIQLGQRPLWHQRQPARIAEMLELLEREREPRIAAGLGRSMGLAWGTNPGLDARIARLASRHPLGQARARLLEGMYEADPVRGLEPLARALREDPAEDVQRVVVELLGRSDSPDAQDDAICQIWLGSLESRFAGVRLRAQEGLVGLRCARAASVGSPSGERAASLWLEVARDGGLPGSLRVYALWALEFERRTTSAQLAALTRDDDLVGQHARALLTRRDASSGEPPHLGRLDPQADGELVTLVERSLECFGHQGLWNSNTCKPYEVWKILTSVPMDYGRDEVDGVTYTPMPGDVVESTLAALLSDPNPRVRWLAVRMIDRRKEEGTLGEGLREALEAASAREVDERVKGSLERLVRN